MLRRGSRGPVPQELELDLWRVGDAASAVVVDRGLAGRVGFWTAGVTPRVDSGVAATIWRRVLTSSLVASPVAAASLGPGGPSPSVAKMESASQRDETRNLGLGAASWGLGSWG
jgi:hypothetical protein